MIPADEVHQRIGNLVPLQVKTHYWLLLNSEATTLEIGFFPFLTKIQMKELRNLDNPVAAFGRDTPELKLMSKVLNQFGKELGIKCPFQDEATVRKEEVREYMRLNITQFLKNFPRLLKLSKAELPPGSAKRVGAVTYMKGIIRTAFWIRAPPFLKRSDYYNKGPFKPVRRPITNTKS